MMENRQQHRQEVQVFLQEQFGNDQWELTLPHGWGNETYYAHANGKTYFVKLGSPLVNYQVMAALGLTLPLIASGMLDDGTTLLVQPFIIGRKPSWTDFHHYLDRMAQIVNRMHHSPELRCVIAVPQSESYHDLGMKALTRLLEKWQKYKAQVPTVAGWMDEAIDQLVRQIKTITGAGAVVAHHDICNANWLITPDDQVYLIDLDGMSLDDPAADLGPVLWWYYPPSLRERFLEIAGYQNNAQLQNRMRLRMAIHSLNILLPRENSFDRFDANQFMDSLTDFKAIIAGEENPRGYADE
jgi:thiamine kinase-like enzyme